MDDYTKEGERIRNLLLDVSDFTQDDQVDLFEDNEGKIEEDIVEDNSHNSGTDEELTSMPPTASSQQCSAKENIMNNAVVCLLSVKI